MDYRTIFDNHPQPMWVRDPRSRLALAVNAAALERYGLTREAFLRTAPDPPPEEASTHAIPFDGRPAELVVLHGADRRRAHEALRRSEEYRRAIIETEPACVKIVSRTGELLDMNPAGLAMLEADSLEAAQQRRLSDYILPECRDAFFALHARVIRGGSGTLEFEVEGLRGTRRHLETHAVPLRDADGRVTALLGVTQDITERKRLQAQVAQAQKMESIGRLAGGVAHDFNNMLGVIRGHAELALRDVAPGSRLHDELSGILGAARRSSELTRQLLAFARRQTAAPRVVDLNASVSSVLGMLERLLGEEISLAWSPAAGLWSVRLDPGQVDQILVNLAVNARDAIEGAGTVTIETANTGTADLAAAKHWGEPPQEREAGDHVTLIVRDDGRGMEPQVLEHLFEPFYTTKELGRGTGLGLATVYGIVQQNGGFIEVESERERGSTFRIHFPRAEGAPIAPPDDADAERGRTPRGRGETILFVEDEPALLSLGILMLGELDYAVLAAPEPKEALRRAREHAGSIDLLLTDVIMPGMNGRELADSLRAERPSVPCVFLSGYPADVLAPHGILDPDVRFLPKPYTMGDLARAVRAAIDGAPAEAAS